jgi:hypothetical protein
MKKALIDPEGRIAQVEPEDKVFQVAEHDGWRWVDCPDDCVAYSWQYVPGANGAAGICSPPPAPTADELAAQAAALLAQSARAALEQSDITILRCVERGVAVPADWVAYRAALRECINGSLAELPSRPEYPAGTE